MQPVARPERTERAPAWRIDETRGRAGLVALEEDWRRLYAELPAKTISRSYDVLLAHVDHLMEAPDRLRCLALSDGDRVRAICLLEVREYARWGLRLRVWRLPQLLHTHVGDVICAEDEVRRRLLPALVSYLRSEPKPLPLLHLGPLPEDSLLWEGLKDLGRFGHWLGDGGNMHVVDCERPFGVIMSGLSKKTRTNLRKARKKLDTLSGVRFETAMSADEAAPAYETFLDLEASGWKADDGLAIRLHPTWVEFYRALTGLHGTGDGCEINMLYAEGRCIASEFCMRTGSEYTAWKIAYDESYSTYAPGLLLVQYSLQRCCDDPRITRLNWVSEAAWERRWHPHTVRLRHAYLALARWSGPALVALLRFKNGPGHHLADWLQEGLAGRWKGSIVRTAASSGGSEHGE